jgi:hypothetical protein
MSYAIGHLLQILYNKFVKNVLAVTYPRINHRNLSTHNNRIKPILPYPTGFKMSNVRAISDIPLYFNNEVIDCL